MSEQEPPYSGLGPEQVLQAVDSFGVLTSGHLLALNSYENRVYQVGIEDAPPLIAKFYRPDRWSNEAILEEHAFSLELAGHEIPVVPPLHNEHGETLLQFAGFRFALFKRHGGRSPELDDFDHLEWLGRFLGRIHAVGAVRPFQHRLTLSVQSHGRDAFEYLMQEGFVPVEVGQQYRDLAETMLGIVEQAFADFKGLKLIRLHGDCHPGNILWGEAGPHFVDLDDSLMGPAIQDLWMLLSGERQDRIAQLDALLEGYREFYDFDLRELRLIEPLRCLRLLHYSAWLARRWHDPAFPAAFPWFNTLRYWEEQVLALREQLLRLDEPPLTLGP